MKMRMVEAGVYNYEVQARCDSYVGCDVCCSIKVVVKKLNATEKTRREKNLELSKDYGLDTEEDLDEEEEEEGVWYYLYFASFWEMIANLLVLGVMAYMGFEFLKSRGIWDKYLQPPIDYWAELVSPITTAIYAAWVPVQETLTPIVTPIWQVIVYCWDYFAQWIVPPEELNPNYKRNRDSGLHDDLQTIERHQI